MTTTTNSLPDDVKHARDDLQRLVGDVKLKVHLARKDAADLWWAALEPALMRAQQRLDDTAGKMGEVAEAARLQAHLGVADVKTSWPGLEKAIAQVVGDAKRAGKDLHATADTVLVKTHLAAMDADLFAARARGEITKLSAEIEGDTAKAVAELRRDFAQLRKKLAM